VALTVAAYGAFLAFLGHVPASASVFALLALTSLPAFSRRHFQGPSFDEREREIASKAQMAGFRAFWLAFVGVIVAMGFVRGWSGTLTLPVWTLSEIICWAFVLVMSVQSVTTIVLYRGGAHA
jgi:Na+/H+ antiporter NhaC